MGRSTNSDDRPVFGAVEAGGTKFRVAVGRDRAWIADTTIPTTTPEETLAATVDFLAGAGEPVSAVGVACFGPLDLDPGSPTYGSIVSTPKPGWSGADIKGRIESALGVPVSIDIDVGGAALAEWLWGAARGFESFVYLTVGTGIGGGLFVNGRVHHGLGHPEMGHVAVAREPDDAFAGRCPYHGACLEGLACGPAIGDRWQADARDLQDRPEVWDLEARYLAQALRTYTYVVAPQRIVLGGGVMQHPDLLGLVRSHLENQLSGYAPSARLHGPLNDYVVAPELGQDAGLYGALALAQLDSER